MIFGVIFDLEQKEKELEKLEQAMAKPDFWQRSQDEISRITHERAAHKNIVDQWQRFHSRAEDAGILARMAREESDESSLKDVEKDVIGLERDLKELEFQSLLGDPDDKRNAIVAINSGAGGTESQDWVEMLLGMYLRGG